MISNIKKNILLDCLKESLGIVTIACEKANVSRDTFYSLLNKNAEFKRQVEDIQNITLDVAENSLIRNIKAGDTTAILFYLKTKGRKRGYVEKQELDLTSKGESIIRQPRPIIVGGVVEDAE